MNYAELTFLAEEFQVEASVLYYSGNNKYKNTNGNDTNNNNNKTNNGRRQNGRASSNSQVPLLTPRRDSVDIICIHN